MLLEACKRSVAARPVGTGYRVTVAANMINVCWFVWHGILFEEPNPTGSRPSDIIGLEEQHMKAHPPNTQGRARRKHRGDRGHPEEAERRMKDRRLEAR